MICFIKIKETTKKRIITDVRVREPNMKRNERNFQKDNRALGCTPDRKRQQEEQCDPKGEVEDYHPRNLSAVNLFFILKT